MAQYYLINALVFAGNALSPGSLIDDTTDDTTALQTAGAVLWPATDATIAAAATVAQNAKKNRGANELELASIMQAAVDSVQRANDTLNVLAAGTATLVAGTVTVAAKVTATSRILTSLNTPGGGGNGVDYKAPAASRVVGAPGSFVITAVDAAGATVATDVSTVDWVVVG